ncbi:riboflavin kinase [Patescibacteria group bacterium]|nr:riboflavin kinase [Patescibacteria group bacterium]
MKKTFTGIIIEGSKKASALGFPTANITVSEPVNGIYAGTVFVEGKEYFAALFGDEKRGLLEAYILNFSGNLYGKHATFTLIEKIREHGTFSDDESLQSAIAADVASVKKYFNLPS